MCIRDSGTRLVCITRGVSRGFVEALLAAIEAEVAEVQGMPCLLYTSDAADERSSVDLGGRRIIKKKKKR